MNGYSNWDTWNCANWCLNSETLLATIKSMPTDRAKDFILSQMMVVKYTYGDSMELDQINLNEVLNAVRT